MTSSFRLRRLHLANKKRNLNVTVGVDVGEVFNWASWPATAKADSAVTHFGLVPRDAGTAQVERSSRGLHRPRNQRRI